MRGASSGTRRWKALASISTNGLHDLEEGTGLSVPRTVASERPVSVDGGSSDGDIAAIDASRPASGLGGARARTSNAGRNGPIPQWETTVRLALDLVSARGGGGGGGTAVACTLSLRTRRLKLCGTLGCRLPDRHPGLHSLPTLDEPRKRRHVQPLEAVPAEPQLLRLRIASPLPSSGYAAQPTHPTLGAAARAIAAALAVKRAVRKASLAVGTAPSEGLSADMEQSIPIVGREAVGHANSDAHAGDLEMMPAAGQAARDLG